MSDTKEQEVSSWVTPDHRESLNTLLEAVGNSLCSGGVGDITNGEEWPDDIGYILEDMEAACEALYSAADDLMEATGVKASWSY